MCCCNEEPPDQPPPRQKNTSTRMDLPYALAKNIQRAVSGSGRGVTSQNKKGSGSGRGADAPPLPTWKRLSKPVTKLLENHPPVYDVLIVGSGYGGGVLGSRTARAGQNVCILERGQERWPGEYPNTFTEIMTNAQVRSAATPQLGEKDAFFDFRLEDGCYVWVGCGLGGGSLVNSGVSIAPDPRVFDDPQWPIEIHRDRDTKLSDAFEKAKSVLRPSKYPHQATKPLPRVTRFQEVDLTCFVCR